LLLDVADKLYLQQIFGNIWNMKKLLKKFQQDTHPPPKLYNKLSLLHNMGNQGFPKSL